MKPVHLVALATLALLLTAVLLAPSAWASSYANLPEDAALQVRIIEKLSSDSANVGDLFHGTLAQPVVVNGRTKFPKGADVTGTVVKVERSGRLSSPGELHLVLNSISASRSRSYSLSVEPLLIKGASHTKSNVGKIGGGTAAGAIIGGIAGGGKGAAIGAGVGAAAGTGVAADTGKHEAVVESETVLTWKVTRAPAPASGYSNPPQRTARSYNSDPPERATRSYNDNESYSSPGDRRKAGRQDEDPDDDNRNGPREFSMRDRRSIRSCLAGGQSGLPPGLAKRDRLPPGLERQVQRNGTLPPGLQKRVQPLPSSCEARLPRLPQDWARVLLGGRVLLLDPAQRIVDLFSIDSQD